MRLPARGVPLACPPSPVVTVEAPWTMVAPGAALMVTVLGLNLLGDGIRDLLDPRLRRQS